MFEVNVADAQIQGFYAFRRGNIQSRNIGGIGHRICRSFTGNSGSLAKYRVSVCRISLSIPHRRRRHRAAAELTE